MPNEPAAAADLRDEFTDFITRHAQPGSDLQAAELVFSELVTNAIENSDQAVWVSLVWASERPVLTVHDLGVGFELPPEVEMPDASSLRGRGLSIVTHLTDHLEVAVKAAGGSRVSATLPLVRASSQNIDPVPHSVDRLLPARDEMDEFGQFGREAFLRALVVQLAQVAERTAGPGAAESLVAEVGSGVGYRMEEAFREVRGLGDAPLSVDAMAELMVDLKAGIDGDFFVIDADEDRIVLGNRRCPFGDAVRHAPALCRMTSSVFGGIGARSRGEAAVHLEERIAVGDPECRVTVWLRPPAPEIEAQVHVYSRSEPRAV